MYSAPQSHGPGQQHSAHGTDGMHNMQVRAELEPQGMNPLPPSNTGMFDPTNESRGPLLSLSAGNNSATNPVLRPPPLGQFSLGLQGKSTTNLEFFLCLEHKK
jgi:hypothetical protein